MPHSNPQKNDPLKQAYERFRSRIVAARKKTKSFLTALEEQKRDARVAELQRKIKGAL